MRQALVLGAGGFIGRYAARALAEDGYAVTGIGHGGLTPQEQRQWGIERWHLADVTADALLSYGGEPEILVQAAGSGSVAFSMTHPVQDFARSVTTTLTALEFVRTAVPRCRFVLPSSAAVYGNAPSLPIRVDAPLSPVSPYGSHKMIAENLCASYSRSFGIRSAIVRLFSVFGIGLRKQLLWDATRKMLAGESVFYGTGEERRDWLHVVDAARLIVQAAHHADATCPVVNGGMGQSIDNKTVVAWIADALDGGICPTFSGSQRGGDPDCFQADVRQAHDWGWLPQQHLQTEIPAIVDWIKAGAL